MSIFQNKKEKLKNMKISSESAKRKAIRAKWDKEIAEALKGKGYDTAEEAMAACFKVGKKSKGAYNQKK
jgi:hypothetical protein